METLKNCHQEAFKPIEIAKGVWMPSDKIDYKSRETQIKKHNENGLLYYEIKNGFEEKTTFFELYPSAKYIQNVHCSLVKKYTYHYEIGAVLKRTTYISCLDKFEKEHIKNEFYYENDSQICLHYLENKPFYYEKTTVTKDKKTVEFWKENKKPYSKHEFYYESGKILTQVQINLPSNTIQQYWEYKYDSNGNCIEKQRFNHQKVAEHCKLFQFDKFNNCIKEQLVFKPSKSLVDEILTLYEYDEQDNWLRKVIYKNGAIQCFVDNKI